MTHIGSIIQSWREDRGLTRLQLSKDICTEKYLYMVEREMRMPSAEILDSFGIRLGVNLFDYFPYLECDEPRRGFEHMNKINSYRWTTNFSLIQSTFEETDKILDFKRPPLKYEAEVNKLIVKMHLERDFEGAIVIIKKLLEEMESKYKEQSFTVLFYVLLANAYRHIGNLEEAFKMLTIAEEIIENKERIISERWNFVFASVSLTKIRYLMEIEDYDKTIEHCNAALEKIAKYKAYEFKSYICFYLAESYYAKGMREEFLNSFKYSLYSLIAFENEGVIKYIANYEPFDKFLSEEGLCKSLVSIVKEKLQAK